MTSLQAGQKIISQNIETVLGTHLTPNFCLNGILLELF